MSFNLSSRDTKQSFVKENLIHFENGTFFLPKQYNYSIHLKTMNTIINSCSAIYN